MRLRWRALRRQLMGTLVALHHRFMTLMILYYDSLSC
jgi:hypothetical protein